MIANDYLIWLNSSFSLQIFNSFPHQKKQVIYVLPACFRGLASHLRTSWPRFIIIQRVTLLLLFPISCKCHTNTYPNSCRKSSPIYSSFYVFFVSVLDMQLVSRIRFVNIKIPIFLFVRSIRHIIATHITNCWLLNILLLI